jgi:hypothetical protein
MTIRIEVMTDEKYSDLVTLEDNLQVHPLSRTSRDKAMHFRAPASPESRQISWIAYVDNDPAGYVTAVVDRSVALDLNEPIGFFTNCLSMANAQVFGLLLDEAVKWLRDLGVIKIRGPMSGRLGDSRGILIEGSEAPPCLGFAHNPAYYDDLLIHYGFNKAMDLFSFKVGAESLQNISRLAKLVRIRNPRVKIRNFDEADPEREIASIVAIYNAAWKHHWSFIPITVEDLMLSFNTMRDFLALDMIKFASIDSRDIGMMVFVPNILDARQADIAGGFASARGMLFGVDVAFRGRGVDILLMDAGVEMIKAKNMFDYEIGWVLESNKNWLKQIHNAFGSAMMTVRKYRIYEFLLD